MLPYSYAFCIRPPTSLCSDAAGPFNINYARRGPECGGTSASGIIACPLPVTRQMPGWPIVFPAMPQVEMDPALQQPFKVMAAHHRLTRTTSTQFRSQCYLPGRFCFFGTSFALSCPITFIVPPGALFAFDTRTLALVYSCSSQDTKCFVPKCKSGISQPCNILTSITSTPGP